MESRPKPFMLNLCLLSFVIVEQYLPRAVVAVDSVAAVAVVVVVDVQVPCCSPAAFVVAQVPFCSVAVAKVLLFN